MLYIIYMTKNNNTDEEYNDDELNISDDIELEEINEDGEIDYKSIIKKLKERVKLLEKEKQDNLNGWMRSQADYKNREIQIQKDMNDWGDRAVKKFAEELLIVLDTYDSARSNRKAWEAVDSNWRAGIEYIFTTFEDKLKDKGFDKFGNIGEDFDPNIHEGLGVVPTDKESDNNRIAEVIMSGYKYKGIVFRAAKVKVFAK